MNSPNAPRSKSVLRLKQRPDGRQATQRAANTPQKASFFDSIDPLRTSPHSRSGNVDPQSTRGRSSSVEAAYGCPKMLRLTTGMAWPDPMIEFTGLASSRTSPIRSVDHPYCSALSGDFNDRATQCAKRYPGKLRVRRTRRGESNDGTGRSDRDIHGRPRPCRLHPCERLASPCWISLRPDSLRRPT